MPTTTNDWILDNREIKKCKAKTCKELRKIPISPIELMRKHIHTFSGVIVCNFLSSSENKTKTRVIMVTAFNASESRIMRRHKRIKTEWLIIFKSWGRLRGRRLFEGGKQFWKDTFWDFYGKRQDFHKILMSLGVCYKCRVQQKRMPRFSLVLGYKATDR